MAKALLGIHASPHSLKLLDEIRSLRQRVTELEQALAEAEAARETTLVIEHGEVTLEEREPVTT